MGVAMSPTSCLSPRHQTIIAAQRRLSRYALPSGSPVMWCVMPHDKASDIDPYRTNTKRRRICQRDGAISRCVRRGASKSGDSCYAATSATMSHCSRCCGGNAPGMTPALVILSQAAGCKMAQLETNSEQEARQWLSARHVAVLLGTALIVLQALWFGLIGYALAGIWG